MSVKVARVPSRPYLNGSFVFPFVLNGYERAAIPVFDFYHALTLTLEADTECSEPYHRKRLTFCLLSQKAFNRSSWVSKHKPFISLQFCFLNSELFLIHFLKTKDFLGVPQCLLSSKVGHIFSAVQLCYDSCFTIFIHVLFSLSYIWKALPWRSCHLSCRASSLLAQPLYPMAGHTQALSGWLKKTRWY